MFLVVLLSLVLTEWKDFNANIIYISFTEEFEETLCVLIIVPFVPEQTLLYFMLFGLLFKKLHSFMVRKAKEIYSNKLLLFKQATAQFTDLHPSLSGMPENNLKISIHKNTD